MTFAIFLNDLYIAKIKGEKHLCEKHLCSTIIILHLTDMAKVHL